MIPPRSRSLYVLALLTAAAALACGPAGGVATSSPTPALGGPATPTPPLPAPVATAAPAPGTPKPPAAATGSPLVDATVISAKPPPAEIPVAAAIVTPVPVARTAPPATPTPSPDPAVWRIEGVVIDDATRSPLSGVCVVLGPAGCQRGSPRTDERGVFSFDAPRNPTISYDVFLATEGYWTVWFRIRPEGPSVYNVALTKR